MKIYLAGPIAGHEDTCAAVFAEAAAKLRAAGHEVFNPIEAEGGTVDAERNKNIAFRRQCLAKDVAWICNEADAMALLPGWEHSRGAYAERYLALAIGIPVRAI